MATLSEQKDLALELLGIFLVMDISTLGSTEELIAALIAGGQDLASVKTSMGTIKSDHNSNKAAVSGAGTKVALKAAMKTILDARPNGADYKRMFGKNDIIS